MWQQNIETILGSKIMLTYLEYTISVIRGGQLNMDMKTFFKLKRFYSKCIWLTSDI